MWQRKRNRGKESNSETRRELLDKLGMETLNKETLNGLVASQRMFSI